MSKKPIKKALSAVNWGALWPFIAGAAILIILVVMLGINGCETIGMGKTTPLKVQLSTQIAATAYLQNHKTSPDLLKQIDGAINKAIAALDSTSSGPVDPGAILTGLTKTVKDPLMQDIVGLAWVILSDDVGVSATSTPEELEKAKPYVKAVLQGLKVAVNRPV